MKLKDFQTESGEYVFQGNKYSTATDFLCYGVFGSCGCPPETAVLDFVFGALVELEKQGCTLLDLLREWEQTIEAE